MAAREPRVVRFGNFELDQRTCELRKHGLKIKLQQRPLQVLNILLKQHGEVVSREELQRNLWPDGVFVDFDHSLNTAVKKLRDALGDTAAAPRYIATVDRQGYRFAVPIFEIPPASEVSSSGAAAAPAPALQPEAKHVAQRESPPVAAHIPPPIASSRWLLWAGIALGVMVLTAGIWWGLRSRWQSKPSAQKMMLAVLPFANLTGDAGQDYFTDGLTEEMIAQLGRIDPALVGVIARTSVMRYKSGQAQLQQIGRDLGVQYVLEGSVRRDGENVRVTTNLVRISDQAHLWSRQYDRALNRLLPLQSEIALEVADEIELTLRKGHERATFNKPVLPNSYEAYDLYLRGRYFWNKRSPYFPQAANYFQQAIAKDPNYAAAYAGLADTYALMSTWEQVPQNEFMPKARAAALKALQIDDNLADAHTSLALISESYDYDWQTAEKEYRRAIQLNPAYATAHHWFAECLMYEGRFDEALAESERAHELDPFSLIIATDRGAILYYARRYDDAISQLRSVLAMDPDFLRAHGLFIAAENQAGRFAEVEAYIKKHRAALGELTALQNEAYLYARWGRPSEARLALMKLKQNLPPPGPYAMSALMVGYLSTNQTDAAIALLQKAYAEHSNVVLGIKVDPVFDVLRQDPRFQDLLHRVGLAK